MKTDVSLPLYKLRLKYAVRLAFIKMSFKE